MAVSVKLCGITDTAGLDAALLGGARYIGLVFFEKSPRNIGLAAAAALAARARGRADVVAVTVDADDARLEAIKNAVQPEYIQCHGRESPARVAAAARFASKGAIVARGIGRRQDLDGLDAYAPAAALFLFDAKPPEGAAMPGGNGAAFDWRFLADARPPRPWLLSGGLSPANVSEAIAAAGAPGVDVSSGVESAPGVKDPAKIAAFLAAAGVAPIARP